MSDMTPIRPDIDNVSPLVSIIMPVYNALPYLRQAVESVLAQTYPEIELILVEDCGSDGSKAMCRSYAVSDQRVRLIELPDNSGAGACRNVGLDAARGEYVTFLDADDFMEPDTIESLMSLMERCEVDMVRSTAAIHSNGKDLNFSNMPDEPRIYSDAEDVRQVARCFVFSPLPGDGHDLNLGGAVWGTFYKHALIGDIRFPERSELPYCEDYSFNYRYALRCRSIAKTRRTFIHYRVMDVSLSRSTDPHFVRKAELVGEYFSKLLRSSGDGEPGARFAALLAVSLLVAGAKRIFLSRGSDRDLWKNELADSAYFRNLPAILPFSRLPLARRIFLRAFYSRSSAALSLYFKTVKPLRKLSGK